MNPFLKDSLGSILRAAIAGPLAWLAAQGMMADSDVEKAATVASGFIVAAGWGVWSKYKSRQRQNTAQAMPKTSTQKEINAVIADGQAPSVTTPTDVVPKLTPSPAP